MKQIYPAPFTLTIYLLLAVMFLLSACTGVGFGGAPAILKIGVVAPFEGLHRPLGYEVLFAVKLAVQERNVQGGINGYQVELVALNDFDDPVKARVQARALVTDLDVLGVVGHTSAVTTLAAMPIYQKAGMAMSVPWTIQEAEPDAGRVGVVSVAANDAETAVWLDTISRERGFNNIGRVSDFDLDSIPSDVQALELATEGVIAGEIILALDQAGISLPLLGHVDVGSPQVVQVAHQAANGLIFVSPGPDPDDIAGTETFVEAYQTLAGFPPGPRAVLAYDATNVLLEAIELALLKSSRQPTRAEISAVINQIQRHGISGDIVFDTQGQRIDAPVWVYQISGEEEYPGVLIAP
jgi:branched-chain amino acid transport system substrate-binding protein